MNSKKNVGIRVIGCSDVTIEGNSTFGFDTAIHLENVNTASVGDNISYTVQSLKILEEIKHQISKIPEKNLSNDQKSEVIKLLEEIKESNKEVAIQKAERITTILSNVANTSPIIAFSWHALKNIVFN